jgi:hypothetical protein
MRFDPATYMRAPPRANTGSYGPQQPVSTALGGDSDGTMSREMVELDDWEDEGGANAGHAPEFRCRPVRRHFDCRQMTDGARGKW